MNTIYNVQVNKSVSYGLPAGVVLSNKHDYLTAWQAAKSSGQLVGLRHPTVRHDRMTFVITIDRMTGQFMAGNGHFGLETTSHLSRVYKVADDFSRYYQSSTSHLWHSSDLRSLIIFDLYAQVMVTDEVYHWTGRMTDIMRDLTGIVDHLNKRMEYSNEPSTL